MSITMLAFAFSVVTGIPYAPEKGASGVGDLYLPSKITTETPIVLMIHGGGFNSGDRYSISGIANYFADQLGYAVFNIEYRLASESARWPACGDDCVEAANYILSDAFKRQYGFGYEKIWICGGSAGGHLALWTLVNLPVNAVAGAVAISPIADPAPDYAIHPGRYEPLFAGDVDLDAMNPCLRVKSGMAPLLITHATDDQTVPMSSSRAFEDAYRAAGNSVNYYEYSCDLEPNTGGHCIWHPNSNPNRLIDSLERKISFFARREATTCEWAARAMDVLAINRSSLGNVSSVDLTFGEKNGLTNRLYVAYGDSYGGGRIGDWQHSLFVREITDEISELRVSVPNAKCYKFFLDVPFPDGQVGVPVKWVTATGTQYVDTGVRLKGGDDVRCTFTPSTTGENMGVMGTRTELNKENVNVVCSGGTFVFDYNSDTTKSDNYKTYRVQTSAFASGVWYDIVLSAAERSVSVDAMGKNSNYCPDVFESTYNCYLFKVSGSPSVSPSAKGAVKSFSIERDGDFVASYVPYRFGETYGLFDRVSGKFKTGIGGELAGVEDADTRTQLTSASETFYEGRAMAEALPRMVSVVDANSEFIRLAFGPDNGLTNKLYLAYGRKDRGEDPLAWENLSFVGYVSQCTDVMTVPVPETARHCRCFLVMPCDGDSFPMPLSCVTGNGTGYFDTGFTVKGGDVITARVMPKTNQGLVFGSRHSSSSGSDRNVVATINTKFMIDYTSSDILGHRCTTDEAVTLNRWYDLVASPAERSVTDVASGAVIGSNKTVCADSFETSSTCYLFNANGQPAISTRFSGSVASFKIVRDGGILMSLVPCRLGNAYGFYDRINGRFVAAMTGTFSGESAVGGDVFFSVTQDAQVRKFGLIMVVK